MCVCVRAKGLGVVKGERRERKKQRAGRNRSGQEANNPTRRVAKMEHEMHQENLGIVLQNFLLEGKSPTPYCRSDDNDVQ